MIKSIPRRGCDRTVHCSTVTDNLQQGALILSKAVVTSTIEDMSKIGRNDPCPCGSGRKYKKCHLEMPTSIPPAVLAHVEKVERERAYLQSLGIRVNYVRPILHEGKRIWALGSRVYLNRPQNETFHEFILAMLRTTLGAEWWSAEEAAAEPHYLMTCYKKWDALKPAHMTAQTPTLGGRWGIVPDGPTRYLMSVAFDVGSLLHTAQPFPEGLLKRLRHREQFQGARYELGIAAIFARLDYELEFLDETTSPEVQHCEFSARSRSSGEVIAVEAKSRHRAGVLNMPGERDEARLSLGDVARHLEKAEQQAPGDRPFLIFIDINAPPSESQKQIDDTWRRDIMDLLTARQVGPMAPTTFTALYVTNFPYHYIEGASAGYENEVLEVLSPFPKHGTSDAELYQLLRTAMPHYGQVPSFDLEGIIEGPQ